MEARLFPLKVEYKGEIHRLRVEYPTFTFEELTSVFVKTFALAPNSFVIQYADAEGDVLNVTSAGEFQEACFSYLSAQDESKALRFSAVSRTHVAFQENVAEPILKAIEKLVETLKLTMEKVKQEQWAQRAHSGVEQTGEAIKTGVAHTGEAIKFGVSHTSDALNRAAKDARESLEHTSEVLNRAAVDARESLYVAGKTIQDIPFDQVLKETGDNLKTAAAIFGEFANDVVEELRKQSVQLAANLPEVSIPVGSTATEAAPAAPAQATEPEWEQVDEQVSVPAPAEVAAEPEVVAVPEPVVSEAEQKWAAHIAMVRDILPGVDAAQIIDRLEQCNGNVEVVVNALMEEM